MAEDTPYRGPVTGHPDGDPADRAKYGIERRGDEGNTAAEAQRLNNELPQLLELIDGRCPVDGLPAGNCAHFPGPQQVLAEDGSVVYEDGYAPEKEKAAREDGRKEPRRR